MSTCCRARTGRRLLLNGWGAMHLTLGALLIVAHPAAARAHPIHTTLTEVVLAGGGTLTIRVRTFADDFSAAVSRFAGSAPRPDHVVSDSAVARYLAKTFVLAIAGRPLPLAFVSQRRTGDVVWLELCGSARSLHAASVYNAMLFDVHADQVNIVKASTPTSAFTTLFSRGDGPRALRL
ncbi:MAG: hypothetical protein IT361_07285 [Gemmatimonadaceae bacterium]|nr:hypothetical protein [Gemmatimonadaceae bacterium]